MSRIVDTIRRRASGGELGEDRRLRRRGDPEVGAVQYFHKGDRNVVESVLAGLERLPIRHLRTAISWCDWQSPGGEEWYTWLLPRLVDRFEVLPCFLYTPPELGVLPKTSSPPRDPQAYGVFIEMVLRRYDGAFTHVELWNEPNNYIEWDWTIDPEWKIFAEMVAGAGRRAAGLGVTPVLGGMSPFDPNWLDLMFKRGAMDNVGVVGVHGFPGTWEAVWDGWDVHIDRVQEVLDRHSSPARIWVTEAGFSTWAHDEFRQLQTMVELAEAPADRVYWYCVQDLAPERETLDGFHCDERAYHFGLQRDTGEAKLLGRALGRGGLDGVRDLVAISSSSAKRSWSEPAALVIGGAGFLGSALADRLASSGRPVVVLDNLSRPGSEENLRRLVRAHGELVRACVGDVRDVFAVRRAIQDCDAVFHLAEPPAGDPQVALDVNARATLKLLEEARRLEPTPRMLLASTADVYGPLDDLDPDKPPLGVDERRIIDPRGGRACSKAAAESYVLDLARGRAIRGCVLRIGCAYGPGQPETGDEGSFRAMILAAVKGREVRIPAGGRMVRDPVYVDDVVDALLAALASDEALEGPAFNVGGGPAAAISARDLIRSAESVLGQPVEARSARAPIERPLWYVADPRAFRAATGWAPRVSLAEGLRRLQRWAAEEPAEPSFRVVGVPT